MVRFGLPKPAGLGHIHNADSDLMHHQYRLSVSSTVESRSSAQKSYSDYCSDLWTFSRSYPTRGPTRTSPSCSTGTLSSPTLRSLPFRTLHPVRTRGGAWLYSWFEDSCDAFPFPVPPLSRSALYTSTMLWPRKRDASTALLHRLHAYMQQHNVDFIVGDFNMSAFSTVGDVFADPEFSAPGNSLLWGLGALEEANRECTGLPKRPCEWRVDSHGYYEFNNADLALGPCDSSAHFPVFLHLRTTNLLGPDSITRSEQAQQRRLERKATRHERRKRRCA